MCNSRAQLIEARTAQTLCHFEYDEAGLLIGEQQSLLGQDGEADKASGFALRHHYDALGRREKTEWLDGALKGHSLQSLAYGSGHVHQLSLDSQTITDIERDDLHRPLSYTFGALAEQRQYDALGRLSQWQLLQSQALAANKPEVLKADAFAGLLMRRRYGYDAASLLTHIDEQHFTTGNPAHNLLARYDYDRQGRLTGWTHSRFATSAAPEDILHRARYAFDAASNRLADLRPLPIEALAGLAAPAEAPNPHAASTQEDWSNTVRANLHREDFDLLQAERRRPGAREPMGPEQGAGVRYQTDSRGNVIERQTTEGSHTRLSWDGANQLIEVAHRNAQGECWQAQYVYDAFSRRVAKQRWRKDLAPTQAGSQAQPERFRFGWDGDRLAWQRDEQTKEESAWLYRPDGTGFEPLARIRTQPQDNDPKAIAQRIEALMRGVDADAADEDDEDNATTAIQPQALLQAMGLAQRKLHVEWFINDHLGTPRQVVDAQGSALWQTDYSPWGERLTASEGENTYTTDQPIRFQGQFEDEESGLYYNRYRYYDPRAGRYLSKDPIGLRGGVNLMGYVGGDPVRWIDPIGLYADVTAVGNSVTINLPIEYTGSASPELIKKFNDGIEQKWSGKFGKYSVVTKVVAPSKDCPRDKKNVSYVTERNDILEEVNEKGNKGLLSTASSKWTAAHEAGHYMNLEDLYSRDKVSEVVTPYPEHKGSIMASMNGSVREQDIANIIKKNPKSSTKCC